MADDELIDVLDEAPDLTNLATVVVNVETSDGRQFSWMLTVEDGHRLSMTWNVEEQDRVALHGGDRVEPVRVLPGYARHTFVVVHEEAS